MRSDFTALTFHPMHGHSRVLMQQGQLVTDAQSNEQTAILLHLLRTLARDVLGQHGGPDGAAGFGLRVVTSPADLAGVQEELGMAADPPQPSDLVSQLQTYGGSLPLLLPGRYYVDGLLVETAQLTSLWQQPFGTLEAEPGRFLLVLDAWEQQVSRVDHPDLEDPAFLPARGADRALVAWRVRAIDGTAAPTIPQAPQDDQTWWTERLPGLHGQPGERGLLSAGTREPTGNDSPCLADPEDGYRGETGQLIRVEVHTGGPVGQATVKWSFDNASVQAAWLGVADDHTLRFDPSGMVGAFRPGAWVELTGLRDDLDGTPGVLVEVTGLDDDELHVTGLPDGVTLRSLHDHLTASGCRAAVRSWDQQPEPGSDDWQSGARRITERAGLDLGQGVQIHFHAQPVTDPPRPRRYRRGDYWLILARPGQVQVLRGERSQLLPDGSVSPHGPDHAYAPLALVDVADNHILTVIADHRRRFLPLPSLLF